MPSGIYVDAFLLHRAGADRRDAELSETLADASSIELQSKQTLRWGHDRDKILF